jgi:WD40 repeat protein
MTAISFVSASLVASGSDDGSVVLSDIRTTKATGLRMAGHSGRVRALAAAPLAGILASGGSDGNVVLWDLGTQTRLGRAVVTFVGAVDALDATGDGTTLVSAGEGEAVLTTTDVDTWRAQACQIAGRDLSAREWASYVGEGFPKEPLCAAATGSNGD